MPFKVKSIVGNRYGKLVVLKFAGMKNKQSLWLCKCDCGNEYIGTRDHLVSGNTRSCGCLSGNQHHGMHDTRLYRIYSAMCQRCYNPDNTAYKHYGARGIKICDEWLNRENGRIKFFEWAKQNGYSDDLSIDRIDVNGNYTPDNCRWAGRSEQGLNKRNAGTETGITGVTIDKKRGKYLARICVNKKQVNLGRFDTLEEAAFARHEGEIKYAPGVFKKGEKQ